MKQLVVAGGVGANSALRAALDAGAGKVGARVFYPELALCTDNGAMIAFAGAMRLEQAQGGGGNEKAGEKNREGKFAVRPRWDLQLS